MGALKNRFICGFPTSPDLEPNLAVAIAGIPRYTTVIHCYYAAVFILKTQTYDILMVLISIDTYKALELARGRLDPGSGTRRGLVLLGVHPTWEVGVC